MTSLYKSINPVNNKLFHTAAMTTNVQLEAKIAKASEWFKKNRHSAG